MTFSIGVVGVGQFGGHFAHLFKLHPGVSEVYAVDELPERAAAARERWGLDGTMDSFEDLLASDVDAVAISRSAGPTGRWWSRRCALASMSIPLFPWRFPKRRSSASSRP